MRNKENVYKYSGLNSRQELAHKKRIAENVTNILVNFAVSQAKTGRPIRSISQTGVGEMRTIKKTTRPIVDPRPDLPWDEIKRQYYTCHPRARQEGGDTTPPTSDSEGAGEAHSE